MDAILSSLRIGTSGSGNSAHKRETSASGSSWNFTSLSGEVIRSVPGPFWAPGGSRASADPDFQSVTIHHPTRRLDGLLVTKSFDELRRLNDVIVGSENIGSVCEPPFRFGHLVATSLFRPHFATAKLRPASTPLKYES